MGKMRIIKTFEFTSHYTIMYSYVVANYNTIDFQVCYINILKAPV